MGFSYPGNLYRFKIKGQLVHSWMITKEEPHLVVGLPFNTPPAKATPPSAATLTASTAEQGAEKVDISITNKTGQPLEVHWVDYEGKEGQPGAIEADAN